MLRIVGYFAAVQIFLASAATSFAGNRDGLNKFEANYSGGFNVTSPEIQDGGASKVSIQSSRGGRAARILWKNTFYDEKGRRSDVRTIWLLRADGTIRARALDPTRSGLAGNGTFTLKHRRILFSASSGDTLATGTISLVGRGALSISLTIDAITTEFHGGRR